MKNFTANGVPSWVYVSLPGFLSILLILSALPQVVLDGESRVGGPTSDAVNNLSAYTTLLQFFPWRSDIYEHIAEIHLEAGESAKAIKVYEQAIDHGYLPLSENGIMTYGQLLINEGRDSEALAIWLDHSQASHLSRDQYQNIFHLQLKMGDLPSAIRTLENTPAMDTELLFMLAQALAVQEPEKAVEVLNSLIDIDQPTAIKVDRLLTAIENGRQQTEPAFYYARVGQELAALGSWEIARLSFEQAVAHNPNYADAWALLGEAREQTGGNGLPDFQQAISLDPRSIAARALFGLYLRNDGQYQKAFEQFHYLSLRQKANPTWQIELGNSMLALGEVDEALRYFQQAVKLDPRNPVAWKSIARISQIHGIDIRDTALPASRYAILFSNNDPQVQVIHGQILQSLGDDRSAERAYLTAIRLDYGYLQAHFLLGVLYLESGNRERAFYHISLATSPGMDYPERDLANRYISIYFGN